MSFFSFLFSLLSRLSVIVFEIRLVTFFFPSGHALCLGMLMSSVMSGGPVAITRTSAHPSAVTNDDGLSRLAFGDLRHPLEFKWAFSRYCPK